MSNKQHKARMAEIAKARDYQSKTRSEVCDVHTTALSQKYVVTRFLKFRKPDAQGRKGVMVKSRKFENTVTTRVEGKAFQRVTFEGEVGMRARRVSNKADVWGM